jgi:hypothetical protein
MKCEHSENNENRGKFVLKRFVLCGLLFSAAQSLEFAFKRRFLVFGGKIAVFGAVYGNNTEARHSVLSKGVV